MACTEASSASLPEPLPATDHQDKKDQFSDLMPAERGGLELSEPVNCSPHQGSEFQAVTTGGMNYAGHCQYPHGQRTATTCLDRHGSNPLQRRDFREKRFFGTNIAFFGLGILCLILFTGVIAASVIAGSKAKSPSLMEQSYREYESHLYLSISKIFLTRCLGLGLSCSPISTHFVERNHYIDSTPKSSYGSTRRGLAQLHVIQVHSTWLEYFVHTRMFDGLPRSRYGPSAANKNGGLYEPLCCIANLGSKCAWTLHWRCLEDR